MSTEHEPVSHAPCGWVKLYHPRGVQVSLPVPCGESEFMARNALATVTAMLDAGWLVQMPGLEAGENVEEIAYCVRKEKDDGGEVTPVIDCYSATEGMVHSFITVYLNTDEQVKDFETASGLSLRHMPLYEGRDKIKRGENRKTDEKVQRCATPFRLVWVANPRYDAKEAEAAKAGGKMYTVPKKKFVRFDGGAKVAQAKPAAETNGKPAERPDAASLLHWGTTLATDPSTGEINQGMLALKHYSTATARACWSLIKEYAEAAGWVWDDRAKKWFVPARDPAEVADETIPF